jgi:hypothetical protein
VGPEAVLISLAAAALCLVLAVEEQLDIRPKLTSAPRCAAGQQGVVQHTGDRPHSHVR